jgi:hypothetical protein
MADCPTRYTLVRYVSGDLDEGEACTITTHVGDCTACRLELEGIEANVGVYAERQAAHLASLKARLERESPERGWTWRRWIPLVGAAAAAAILVALVFLWPRPPEGEVGFKGAVSFRVVVKRGEAQDEVRDGDRLGEGDALRFVVTTDRAGHLSVFSVDQRGRVNPFYPRTSAGADPAPMRIERTGRTELPGSVILDDWVGEETLMMVFAEQAFDRRSVHGAARRLILDGKAEDVDAGALGIRGVVRVLPVVKTSRAPP